MVKQLPIFARGFDIEAELTVKALARGYRLTEIPVGLRPRQHGSFSKIRIVSDGIKILTMVFALMRDYKPFTTFGSLGLIFIGTGLIPGLYAVIGFLETGLVENFPSAILSVGMILTGLLCITVGLILHTLNRRFSGNGILDGNLLQRFKLKPAELFRITTHLASSNVWVRVS